MKQLKLPTFIAAMLIAVSLVGCSKQSPVIEKTEVMPEPKKINEVEATQMLTRSSQYGETAFEIQNRRTDDFNWVSFWNSLPTELNFEKMEKFQVKQVLRLGTIACQQKELDEFGKFIVKMSKQDRSHEYEYLLGLQMAHFACQKDLNSFQVRQGLGIYRDIIQSNKRRDKKIRGLDHNYVDYLRFLHSLAHIGFQGAEIEILLQTDHDAVLEPLKDGKHIEDILVFFTALKGLAPFQQQLWQKPLNVLLKDESSIVNALKGLSLTELIIILEQVKVLIAKNYKLETKFAINDLIVQALQANLTSKKPNQVESFHLYIAQVIQASGRIYHLQKSIFSGNLHQILTANDISNYEILKAIKGMSDLFLQENATRLNSSPYFLYLDQYVRRFEASAFQSVQAHYGDEFDEIDQYFNLRNNFSNERVLVEKEKLFNQLCALVGDRQFERSSDQPRPGCYNFNDQSFQDKNFEYRVNDHAYFKSYDKNIQLTVKSITGGVFNLSAKKEHRDLEQIAKDNRNDAIVFPLVFGFKYVGQDSVCFTKNNVYYLPFNFLYQEAKAGYLPETLQTAATGFSGANLTLEIDQDSLNIKPEFISIGGAGQTGASGMSAGAGRNIQYSETRMAIEFIEGMEGNHIEYLYRPCRTVPELRHLLANSEKGNFNGVVSTKAFIDLNYLDFIKQADADRFIDDSKIFQTEQAAHCQDDKCLTEELGKMAAQKLLSLLLEAENNGVPSTTIIDETKTRYRIKGHSQAGEDQPSGKEGNNGEIEFVFF